MPSTPGTVSIQPQKTAGIPSAERVRTRESIELQDAGNVLGRTNIESSASAIQNDATPPENAVSAKITWNNPRINVWRIFATFYSFIVVGANDAVYGVSIDNPQLVRI